MSARHALPRAAGFSFRGRLARTRAILAACCVLGIGASVTLAAWNDQELAKVTITSGKFAIESQVAIDTWASNGTNAVTLPLNSLGLKPGDVRAAWVQIRTSSGSVAGNVVPTEVKLATSPDPLADPNLSLKNALTVRIGPVAATTGCTASYALGAVATGIGTLPSEIASVELLANSTSVATYCVVVSLPMTAPNEAQNGSVIPTWTFTGTST